MSRLKRICLATAAVALASGALAADQQTADQLQSQLRAMMKSWGNPLSDQVNVKPEDDAYSVEMPLMGWRAQDGTTPAVATATAKPVGNGSWSIDNFELPSPATIMTPGPDGKPVDRTAISFKEQTSRWTFDPAANFITAESVLLNGISFHDVKPGSPEQHIGSFSMQGGLSPTGPDHGTLDGTGEAKDIAITGKDDKGPVYVTIGRLGIIAHVTNAARAQIAQLMSGLRQLGSMPTPPKGGQPTPEQRAAMVAMFNSLNGIADSGNIHYAVEHLNVTGSQDFGIDHLGIGIAASAPEGLLKITFDLGVDGIKAPEMPATMKAYIPTHLQIQPYVTGVSAADVPRIAAIALGDQGPDAAAGPAMQAAFAHGGLKIGLETLSIDIGPAKITGVGEITVAQPDPSAITGEAKLTGKGIDELLKQVQADPQAAQAVPMLVFARGLAKPQPDGTLFWDVVYNSNGLLVNGVVMMPPGGPASAGGPGGSVPPDRDQVAPHTPPVPNLAPGKQGSVPGAGGLKSK